MKNHLIVGLAACAAAFAGCSKQPASELKTSSSEGAAKFNVEIPGTDDAITSADLTLTCPGFTQTLTLDLSDSLVTASFGGIAPGTCTVSLAGVTEAGYPCAGSADVEILANQVVEPTVQLVCTADPDDESGSTNIGVEIVSTGCAPKVGTIYAVPASVPVPESTDVQLVLRDGESIASASLAAAANSDGSVSVSELASCADGATNCWSVSCLAAGVVVLDVTTDDGAGCDDTKQVTIECGPGEPPPPVCGNGVVEGDEVCDDGNAVDGDGCESDCTETVVAVPVCGDGVVEGDEVCDDGNAVEGDGCESDCTETVVTPPVCGDGVVEGDEVCDDGNLVDGDGCESDCTETVVVTPVCGNGVVEEGEACDDGNDVDGDGCESDCSETPPPPPGGDNACLDCMTNPDGIFYTVLGQNLETCLADPDCETMLTCYTESRCANSAGSVAECVCGFGADIDACNQGNIEATGVCVEELRAIVGDVSNADLLLAVTSQQNASGQAYALYNPAATNAQAQCNADAQCGGDAVSPAAP